jgi:hypothetical protein
MKQKLIQITIDQGEKKMKKFMAVAVIIMMVFAFGIISSHAQQADTTTHHSMMKGADCPMMHGTDCPMMAKAEGTKCPMMSGDKCPMSADKCPMQSHHDSKTSTAPEKSTP